MRENKLRWYVDVQRPLIDSICRRVESSVEVVGSPKKIGQCNKHDH